MNLTSKLKFSPDKPLWLLDTPDSSLESLFPDLDIRPAIPAKGSVYQALLFARDRATLEYWFHKITARLNEGVVFWIAYPKKSSGIISDLLETKNWQIVFDTGYRIVSSAAIDDTWSGVRIKKHDPEANYKSSVPIEQRKTEGVDYVKRIVKLPEDVSSAMKPYKGMEEFFYSMSFTHKKEYMEAIAEAKKPETRQRRIEKMIEMVQKIRQEKELKKKKA